MKGIKDWIIIRTDLLELSGQQTKPQRLVA